MGKGGSKVARDNRANQLNPKHPAYAQSRESSSAGNINRSMQLNPETETYRKSRKDSGKSSEKASDGE